MEIKSNRPLDNLTRSNPLSMLEALIPFVDYPMNLILALMIKYQEVRLILNAFQSIDTLSKYGLHNTSNDPMEMLGNIMGISPDMLKTLMSLMESQNNNLADTFSGLNNNSNSYNNSSYNYNRTNYNEKYDNYVNQSSSTTFNSDSIPPDFDDNIRNIFAEYDLLQAAEYNEKNEELQATSLNDTEKNTHNYDEYIINKPNNNYMSESKQSTEPEYYI